MIDSVVNKRYSNSNRIGKSNKYVLPVNARAMEYGESLGT